jgi:hypothetical protein
MKSPNVTIPRADTGKVASKALQAVAAIYNHQTPAASKRSLAKVSVVSVGPSSAIAASQAILLVMLRREMEHT